MKKREKERKCNTIAYQFKWISSYMHAEYKAEFVENKHLRPEN